MSRRIAARALPALLFVALGLASSDAGAYCRTRGCDSSDRSQDCVGAGSHDRHGCLLNGPLLFWSSSCVSFDLQKEASSRRGITYEQAKAAVVRGFQQWLNADCGEGTKPRMDVANHGPVACRDAEYNQKGGNANIVMFRDDGWPYDNASETLALTTLIFNANSGEIYDADIEVNTFENDMVVDGNVGLADFDFNSVITHEIGHFLGLSHSDVPGSTMLPAYNTGSKSMADIEADDVAGICDALAPDREVRSKSCEPRHGFSGKCGGEDDDGCSVSARALGATSPPAAAFALALFGTLGALARRRSRKRRLV